VILGLAEAPSYARDILALWGPKTEEENLLSLIDEIDRALQAHSAALRSEAERVSWPKIFISHRHKDQEIARALTEALQTAFDIRPRDIRCTSVQPYRLPFGKNTGERLRDEISHAKAVLGILAPDTSQSSYVMFELGAAWGSRRLVEALCGPGPGRGVRASGAPSVLTVGAGPPEVRGQEASHVHQDTSDRPTRAEIAAFPASSRQNNSFTRHLPSGSGLVSSSRSRWLSPAELPMKRCPTLAARKVVPILVGNATPPPVGFP
jgi:hypothetical protein